MKLYIYGQNWFKVDTTATVPPEIPLLTSHSNKRQSKEEVAGMIAGVTSAIVKAISQPAKEKLPTK